MIYVKHVKKKDNGHNEDHSFIKIKRNISQTDTKIDTNIWDSKFICDISFPDGTTLPVCNKFTKIWRLENSGTAKWPIGTKLVYVGGDQFGTVPELIVPSIEPRQHVDISLDCLSPKQPGRYVCYWRLASPNGQQFGVKIWVTVITEKSKERNELAKIREEEILRMKKLEEEKKEQERLLQLKADQEKQKREQERLQIQLLTRLEQERREKQRLENEKFAKERLEKEQAERERLEKEKIEKIEKEKNRTPSKNGKGKTGTTPKN